MMDFFIADEIIKLIRSQYKDRTISEHEKLMRKGNFNILCLNPSNFDVLAAVL